MRTKNNNPQKSFNEELIPNPEVQPASIDNLVAMEVDRDEEERARHDQSQAPRRGVTGARARRARGGRIANIGDQTNAHADTARPRFGPGSRGGRGSRVKRSGNTESNIERKLEESINSLAACFNALGASSIAGDLNGESSHASSLPSMMPFFVPSSESTISAIDSSSGARGAKSQSFCMDAIISSSAATVTKKKERLEDIARVATERAEKERKEKERMEEAALADAKRDEEWKMMKLEKDAAIEKARREKEKRKKMKEEMKMLADERDEAVEKASSAKAKRKAMKHEKKTMEYEKEEALKEARKAKKERKEMEDQKEEALKEARKAKKERKKMEDQKDEALKEARKLRKERKEMEDQKEEARKVKEERSPPNSPWPSSRAHSGPRTMTATNGTTRRNTQEETMDDVEGRLRRSESARSHELMREGARDTSLGAVANVEEMDDENLPQAWTRPSRNGTKRRACTKCRLFISSSLFCERCQQQHSN